MVADLIDDHFLSWREDLVRALFFVEDAGKILTIPLSSHKPDDKTYWACTKSGKFTVKSAYHLAVAKFSRKADNIPSASNTNVIWKNLWQISTPPKIGHFLWSACLDTLPTMQNLIRRGMYVDPACCRSGEDQESLSHVLVECPFVQQVWRLSPIRFDTQIFGRFPFLALCGEMLKNPKQEGAAIFTLIAWHI